MTQADERSATLSDLVAEEVRALLARRRMSGRQLAVRLGVSPSWVSYRLTGIQTIDLNDVPRIAKALGVSPAELIEPALAALPSTPNDRLERLTRTAPADRMIGAHTVPATIGVSPSAPQRRDSTRPPSAVPATSRRPTRSGPPARPMAA